MLENQEETKTPDTEESTVENQEESVIVTGKQEKLLQKLSELANLLHVRYKS